LNWATAVVDYIFTQWFNVGDQRNLTVISMIINNVQTRLKDVVCREIAHFYTHEAAVPDDIR